MQGRPGPNRSNALLALTGLVLVAFVTFRSLAAHPTDLLVGPQRGGLNDSTALWLAMHEFPANEFETSGVIAQWNPHRFTGTPFAGYPASAWLYPPT